MSTKCVLNKSTLTGIADAIRAKGGTTETMKPGEMAAKIEAIPSGGGGGEWVRPAEWPDLDNIAINEEEIFVTYDRELSGEIFNDTAYFCVTAVGGYKATRGNVQNGVFVPSESAVLKTSGSLFTATLTDRITVFKFEPQVAGNKIEKWGFYTGGNFSSTALRSAYYCQPIGEVRALLKGMNGDRHPAWNKYVQHISLKDCVAKTTACVYMFYYCPSLRSVNLSGLDTSAVTSMANMFYYCTSLQSVDLSSFDTSAVTSMRLLFGSCSSLHSVDLSGLDTSAVMDMANMFSSCTSLRSVNLSGLDTSAVVDMKNMFYSCASLCSVDFRVAKSPSSPCDYTNFLWGDVSVSIEMTGYEFVEGSIGLQTAFSTNLYLAFYLGSPVFHESFKIVDTNTFTTDRLHVLLANLPKLPSGTTKTATLGSGNLSRLSAEDRTRIVDELGWTLA